MAIANKLQTVEDGCMDIRAAIQEKDNTKGHGAISTLADDIRTLNSNNRVVKWYRDPDDGEYKIYTKEATSGTTITAPMTGIEGKELIAYMGAASYTTIGASAFANNTTVQYINFENIKTIGNTAFSGTTSLTMSARFPNLTSVGNTAFQNCRFNEILDLGKITSVGYTQNAGGCFGGSSIKKVIFPSNFTSLGRSAFNGCTYLEEAIFSSTTPVVIGRESFMNCTNLKTLGNLRISGFDGLGNFYGCSSLGPNLDFSDSTFTIFGYNASSNGQSFRGCTSIVTITLPTTCNAIGYRCLYGCTNLTTINGLNRLVYARNGCCYNCSKLTGEFLADNLLTIDSYAFYNCRFTKVVFPSLTGTWGTSTSGSGVFQSNTSLTYAEYGPNCTEIGQRGFQGCTALTTFVCRAETPPTLGANVFTSTNANLKIYVPYSADDSIINAYKSASNWSAQASKIYSLDENGEIPV